MPRATLAGEIAAGVMFSGWTDKADLVGVMGRQQVRDATLIRHAYVRPSRQRRGIGSALLAAVASATGTRLMVGTWAAADWAIRFYQQHGFRPVSPAETQRLLETYWRVPRRQQESSVVLVR
jgi:GNAT superfamily N-acetyltransferase